ncbi:MAG: glycoside hydrolase family 29 [Saprospiraceae bacterium]|nr:MAG: glycoside hydrolase family 29 [Saprospiraceae bacterium]
MKNRALLLLLSGLLASCTTPPPPAPFGAVPSARQLGWHKLKYYAFLHFGPNTFTDIEWGHGDESPDEFFPTELDCRQWARVIKDAGMEGVIITAKHHDGFCLWPSKYSTHTVRESRWREGKGDVLKDLSEACREYGLKFGVYLSPWDRNHPTYGTSEYNDVFKSMLKEVLTQYGEVFEVWFDGANGEGPNGKKQVYDFPGFAEVVRQYQPGAVIFSDGGPDIRWVGNEQGYAAETNWCTVKDGVFYPGIGGVNDQLQHGHEDGNKWLPTEVNTSIRPGWFYHAAEDSLVKSLHQLAGNWYHSVGMNGNFLLNIPVDNRGLIHENDAARLMELKAWGDASFRVDLTKGATATSVQVRGHSKKYCAQNAIDGNPETYWATDEGTNTASIEIAFGKETEMNAVLMQEYIALGQRVKSFTIEALLENEYRPVATGTTVGNRRIVPFETLKTDKLRIIFNTKACPAVHTIEVYKTVDVE